ncbi:type VI secretion system baseplate subunit TssE [Roseiconus lacunae]|uniref:Type VI secretion system baseplate subunit TssE n=1 Tax=Roseiconus lacunae TaxID=2605694 RepID=A0ABT7PDZ9_9BACT|nr:type VI secretion system baseplate subunit TssE [Roseiconus lacunae]MCD0463706.1 type VI secretion system baseplate subunit TssE [Roseiconus lacunae]MDM4014728.1 type VI secretion system baseplate subunit TssE [Roseiconus lacunae]WRQ50318.1 type VI secretion system baseplate subunit TssE [Stieleria sp. HD01]
MADLTTQEKLFPSLLDRLTDDQPQQRQETRDKRVFSVHRLRAAVLRDLAWLLNTCHLAAAEDLSHYAEVERSVVNYGIPDLTGKTVSGLHVEDVQAALRKAILDFEPRILADTLEVRGNKDPENPLSSSLTFEIEGELWARPYPERLYLRSELDLETGDVNIHEV